MGLANEAEALRYFVEETMPEKKKELLALRQDIHGALATRQQRYNGDKYNGGSRSRPHRAHQPGPALAGHSPGTQKRFDDLMNAYIAKGKLVWSSPDVQTKMGAKDALCKIANMNCGLVDTLAYYTEEELTKGFKTTCAFQPRVIKQNRGSAGEGIWLCWLCSGKYCDPAKNYGDKMLKDDDMLKLMEMNDNHVEYHTVRRVPRVLRQRPGLEEGGQLAVGLPGQVPRGRQGGGRPARRPAPAAAHWRGRGARPDGGRHLPDDHPQEAARRPLGGRRQLGVHLLQAGRPQVQRLVPEAEEGHPDAHEGAGSRGREEPLPLLWTADYIPKEGRRALLCGPAPRRSAPTTPMVYVDTEYVVGEFNCSCVGISKFQAVCGGEKTLADVPDEDYYRDHRGAPQGRARLRDARGRPRRDGRPRQITDAAPTWSSASSSSRSTRPTLSRRAARGAPRLRRQGRGVRGDGAGGARAHVRPVATLDTSDDLLAIQSQGEAQVDGLQPPPDGASTAAKVAAAELILTCARDLPGDLAARRRGRGRAGRRAPAGAPAPRVPRPQAPLGRVGGAQQAAAQPRRVGDVGRPRGRAPQGGARARDDPRRREARRARAQLRALLASLPAETAGAPSGVDGRRAGRPCRRRRRCWHLIEWVRTNADAQRARGRAAAARQGRGQLGVGHALASGTSSADLPPSPPR